MFSKLILISILIVTLASCCLVNFAWAAQQNADTSAIADTSNSDDNRNSSTADDAKSKEAGKRPYAEDAVKHYNRGVELHQTGFLNQAIAEYRLALAADDRMEEAWSNLGGIYAAQRSYAKATEAFQHALELSPARPTTLNGYGTVLYARGKIDEAKEKWRQAIKVDPTFASAYYNMGNALEGEHQISAALAEYVRALAANPNMSDAYYRIGSLYLKQKHLAQAKTMLAKAAALAPDAEFIRDTKKQLAALDSEFAGEPAEPVECNSEENKESPMPAKSCQAASAASDKAAEADGLVNNKQEKPSKKNRKKKRSKQLDMIVQPATQDEPSDLKEQPSPAN